MARNDEMKTSTDLNQLLEEIRLVAAQDEESEITQANRMSPMSSKQKADKHQRLIFNSLQFQQNFLMSPDEQTLINQINQQNARLADGTLNQDLPSSM